MRAGFCTESADFYAVAGGGAEVRGQGCAELHDEDIGG